MANTKGEIWMLTDRHRVPDLTAACLNASAKVSTILIREKDWSLEKTAEFCHGLVHTQPRLILNWNGTFDPTDLPIQGIHLGFELAQNMALPKNECLTILKNKKPLWKIGASVHSQNEWDIIKKLPLDYVLLSNVFETPCKPNKVGLGLNGLASLFEYVQMSNPLIQAYALGGLKTQDLEPITTLGLRGIVLRSAFF